jgi:ubiquitin carboxyl-terminal hydrolase 36/42
MGGKITKHISFSQRLDLTRFLCPRSANCGPTPLTYRLVSVVSHVGSSVHCGHYTAVALTSTGHYYQFDDSSVRPISLSAALDTNAYIMLYERESKIPPISQQSVASATTTVATCVVNGQKPGLSAQSPVSHKTGSIVNSRQVMESSSAAHTCASPLPPQKDR